MAGGFTLRTESIRSMTRRAAARPEKQKEIEIETHELNPAAAFAG
jgi:hypothetical protein